MRSMTWGTLFVLSLMWSTVATGKELSPREIYEQASPAVVMVMGYADGGRKGSGGTGSIIQSDGLVLTNAHVVIEEQTGKPFARLSVFLKPARVTGESKSDLSRMVRAKVVAYSQPLDLALLKLDGVTEPLPVVDVSESGRARIGDRVVAIGHPEQGGLWTLTTGVISAEVDNFNGVKGKHVFQTETGSESWKFRWATLGWRGADDRGQYGDCSRGLGWPSDHEHQFLAQVERCHTMVAGTRRGGTSWTRDAAAHRTDAACDRPTAGPVSSAPSQTSPASSV